jgi:hypothetical protein
VLAHAFVSNTKLPLPIERDCLVRNEICKEVQQGELRKLPLRPSITALPTGSTLCADGAMDVVVVRACFAHGLETPVGGGGSEQFGVFFCEVAKGTVGGLAAE